MQIIKDLFDNELQLFKYHKLEFGTWISQLNTDVQFRANDTLNILDRSDEALQSSFYLQDKWRIINPLELTIGLRATNYEPTQKTYYEPRASLTFSLPMNMKLKGAWGEYHQFVNRVTNENVLEGNRDFWILANDNLDPGFAEHSIIGLSYENDDYLFDV